MKGRAVWPRLRFGGDGDELKRGGKPPVNHVNIIAQQTQPVELDTNGEGTLTLPIGDFNGELRLMAQAWTEEDFGSSESKVIVAAPVITELNTPRFLASGDTSRLTLDLTNLTDQPQTLNVALTANGKNCPGRNAAAAGSASSGSTHHDIYPGTRAGWLR
ncbi:protein YfhM [Enterobacter cancerogenus]|uniref:Protein YfhM n=1 Tax=Enterobacter cancerogenus TaxID=69218 RepID=A0A484Z5Z5_9ENTR|nr:protein YfhM [Enterobacter cancerogenus]